MLPLGPAATASAADADANAMHPRRFRRLDECHRVIKAGARVLTLDQLEGLKDPGLPCWTNEAECDGDPPRLWAASGMYPGTAFTRSIGDSGEGALSAAHAGGSGAWMGRCMQA